MVYYLMNCKIKNGSDYTLKFYYNVYFILIKYVANTCPTEKIK